MVSVVETLCQERLVILTKSNYDARPRVARVAVCHPADSEINIAFLEDKVSVKVTQAACIRAELEEMHQQVSQRAFEISRMNQWPTSPDENWYNAQRELIWEPPVEVRQVENRYEIVAAVAGVPARDIEVQITPEALLIKGSAHKECHGEGVVRHCDFSRGQLFRPIHFPEAIDIENATADYRDGLLRLTVPVASSVVADVVEPVEVVEEIKPAAAAKAKARKAAAPRSKRSKGN